MVTLGKATVSQERMSRHELQPSRSHDGEAPPHTPLQPFLLSVHLLCPELPNPGFQAALTHGRAETS